MTASPSQQIMQMDGVALTRVAWALGLAPQGVLWDDAWLPQVPLPCWQDRHGILLAASAPWNPHEHLATATDVLHQLRTRGWDTHVQYFARTGTGQVGVWKPREEGAGVVGQVLQWQDQAPDGEAMALLRCAVLAVMQEGTR